MRPMDAGRGWRRPLLHQFHKHLCILIFWLYFYPSNVRASSLIKLFFPPVFIAPALYLSLIPAISDARRFVDSFIYHTGRFLPFIHYDNPISDHSLACSLSLRDSNLYLSVPILYKHRGWIAFSSTTKDHWIHIKIIK